jgi:hypothetical protein
MPQIGVPQNVTATLLTDNSVTVTWSVGLMDNPGIVPGPPPIVIRDNFGGSQTVVTTTDSAIVGNLRSGSIYTFTVVFAYTAILQPSAASSPISTPGGGSGGTGGNTPKPTITRASTTHVTIKHGCRIHLDWNSSSSYTNCLISYGIQGRPQIKDEGAGGTSGFFDFGADQGQVYQFSLYGKNSWPNTNPDSGWTDPYTIVAAPNTTSLVQYLDGTDASHGLRNLMKGNLSLRTFMEL